MLACLVTYSAGIILESQFSIVFNQFIVLNYLIYLIIILYNYFDLI